MAHDCLTNFFLTRKVNLYPSKLSDDKIIYSNRYEQGNGNTGIFEYNIRKGSNELIVPWSSIKYYPRFNSIIYSKIHNTLYSVGGWNVKHYKQKYKIIMIYNLSSGTAEKIQVELEIGKNPSLLLTHNDNYLHILCGDSSSKHILVDLNTNKYQIIHDFVDDFKKLWQQGAIYNPQAGEIYMFGGYGGHGNPGFTNFWVCDIKIDQTNMRKIINSWSRLIFNKTDNIPSEIVNEMLSI